MPDFPHEIHVEMFRNRGELARELLDGSGRLQPALRSKELEAYNLSNEVVQLKPTQHRADNVILYRDNAKKAHLAVIVEVQSIIDERKPFTWPLYVASVRERHECPTYLLVFALKPEIARWAKASIDLGHPDFHLRPLVLTHEDVPKMNLESVAESPEMVVLQAMARRTVASAKAAMKVLRARSDKQSGSYLDAVLTMLPASVRKHLEGNMEGYVYKSEFFRKNIAKWRRAGRRQGMKEGMKEGVEKGMKEGVEKGLKVGVEKGVLQGKQDDVLAVARQKLGKVSAAEISTIRSICEEAALTALLVGLAGAPNAKSARAVLAKAKKKRAKN